MAPVRSEVWKHFRKTSKTSAKCTVNLCNAEVGSSGNTKNLWNHLARHHNITKTPKPGENMELETDNPDNPPVPDSNRSTASQVSLGANTATSAPSLSSTLTLNQRLQPQKASSGSNFQPTIPDLCSTTKSFEDGGSRDKALKDALIYFVCRDKMPVSIVENEGFRYFVHTAVPRWRLPHRTTLMSWVEEKYEKLEGLTIDIIAHLESYSLCADIWTEEHTTTSYLGVVLQYHDRDDMSMKTVQLSMMPLEKPHCTTYLSEVTEEILKKWGIDKRKVMLCITDGAENVKQAAYKVFGKEKWQPCFAHQVNLLCSDMMKSHEDPRTKRTVENVPGLRGLISKVKKIAGFFHKSINAADKLRNFQIKFMGKTRGTALRMIQECPTRWNSTYFMLERFLELAEPIGSILLGCKEGPVMLTASELHTAQSLCSVLFPLLEVTLAVSAEKSPTASSVIPLVNMMRQGLTSADVDGDVMSKALQEFLLVRIDYRFSNLGKVTDFAVATLLDPRYKKLHFSNITDLNPALRAISNEMRREARTEVTMNREAAGSSSENVVDGARPKKSIWDTHVQLATKQVSHHDADEAGGLPVELRQYLNRPTLDIKDNPFQQWEVLKSEYPNLYKVAMRYLPLIASSVAAERLFSRAGLVATDLRNRLSTVHLSQLLFLSSAPLEIWQRVI